MEAWETVSSIQNKKGKCRLQGEGFALFLRVRGRIEKKGKQGGHVEVGTVPEISQWKPTSIGMVKDHLKNKMTSVNLMFLHVLHVFLKTLSKNPQ